MNAGFRCILAALGLAGGFAACRDAEQIPRSPPELPPSNIAHAVIGRWSYPIDGQQGFTREFKPDGSVTVWWPDGKLAARGKFFVVGTNAVGVDYENNDRDVVVLLEPNLIRIDHVEHEGYHRKFHAARQ